MSGPNLYYSCHYLTPSDNGYLILDIIAARVSFCLSLYIISFHAEAIQLYGCFSLSFSSFTFLLKRLQSQSEAFLHGKDVFTPANILVQVPPME
jgi:hypothetical protein